MCFNFILSTKFIYPKVPDDYILTKKIESLLKETYYKLTYISSPSGYGKTSLLSKMIEESLSKETITFLSLDEEDNILNNFIHDLVFSFKEILKEDEINEIISIKNTKSKLIKLISSINDKKIFIILDNFHHIENKNIKKLLVFFINNTNDNIFFIISSKTKIPDCFFSLLINEKVKEVDENELKLDKKDLIIFFNKKNIFFSDFELDTIQEYTEGWALAIKTIYINAKNNKNISLCELINNTLIKTFFSDQVFNLIPDEFKLFTIKTSLLKNIEVEISNEILDITKSQVIVDYLIKNNLFIVTNNKNIRYHKLFSNYLLKLLESQYKDQLKELSFKISQIMEKKHNYIDSANYILYTNDDNKIMAFLERNILNLFNKENLHDLLKIFNNIPIELIAQNRKLFFFYTWILIILNELESKIDLIKVILKKLLIEDKKDYKSKIVTNLIYLSVYSVDKNNLNKINKYRNEVLNKIDLIETDLLEFVYFQLSLVSSNMLEINKSNTLLNKSILISEKKILYISCIILFSKNNILTGNLNNAEYNLKKILEDFKNKINDFELLEIFKILSIIYYYKNDMESFKNYINQANDIIEKTNNLILKENFYIMLLIFNLKADVFNSFSLYYKKLELLQLKNNSISSLNLSNEEINVFRNIEIGQSDLVNIAWEEETKEYINITYKNISFLTYKELIILYLRSLSIINYYINKKQFIDANNILDLMLEISIRFNIKIYEINIYILKSIVNKKINKMSSSSVKLKRAIQLAEEQNYIKPFIDHKDEIKDILIYICSNLEKNKINIKNTFEYKILKEINNPIVKNLKKIPSLKKILNPLSHKEKEIILLIKQKISNKDISIRLNISYNTLKTHIKNIYKKLGVNTRIELLKIVAEFNIV